MELHDVEEAMGMRKILAHDIRTKKNPQTKGCTFWIFTDFHAGPKSNMYPARIFHQWRR